MYTSDRRRNVKIWNHPLNWTSVCNPQRWICLSHSLNHIEQGRSTWSAIISQYRIHHQVIKIAALTLSLIWVHYPNASDHLITTCWCYYWIPSDHYSKWSFKSTWNFKIIHNSKLTWAYMYSYGMLVCNQGSIWERFGMQVAVHMVISILNSVCSIFITGVVRILRQTLDSGIVFLSNAARMLTPAIHCKS